MSRKKRQRKEARRVAAGKPPKRPGILFGKDVLAALRTLERDGIVEFDEARRYVGLTAKGMEVGAARREARERGLDPDEVAPV